MTSAMRTVEESHAREEPKGRKVEASWDFSRGIWSDMKDMVGYGQLMGCGNMVGYGYGDGRIWSKG